jgi:hypothetical protein
MPKDGIRCAFCNRKPLSPSEGRRIDGTWARDCLVARQYRGAWVCSFMCYEGIVNVSVKGATNRRPKIKK